MVWLLIYQVGYVGGLSTTVRLWSALLAGLFAAEHWIAWWLSGRTAAYRKTWGFHIGVACLVLPAAVVLLMGIGGSPDGKVSLLTFGLIQGAMILSLGFRALRHQAQITSFRIRPGWIFMGSFLSLISVGALLLKLPRAVIPGASLSWLDALFTSTSAVCVTGLTVVNTADLFSTTGQVIILGLIQAGGLGVMTLTFYLATLLFGGMSLHDRQVLGEMISEKHLAQVTDAVRFIVVFTLVTETLGAAILFLTLPFDQAFSERLFQAVFHSVSAFCNAGFSTLPNGLADDCVRDLSSFQFAIGMLVIAGGLGWFVVRDVMSVSKTLLQRWKKTDAPSRRLRVHTRVVLWTTMLLLLGGAAWIYLSEFVFFAGEQNGGAVWTACFHSITARTAGFNTVNTAAISPLTGHILIALMLIGGSPGGTAGGVRTTVFAVAAVHLWNVARSVPRVVLFKRRLPDGAGPRALAIWVLSTSWLFVSFIILDQIHPETEDSRLAFELVSAFATVGLSMDVTPHLAEPAKCLIILNMFVGRMGLMTVILTLVPVGKRQSVVHPTEDVLLS